MSDEVIKMPVVETTKDRIRSVIVGSMDEKALTPYEREMMDRWDYADNMLLNSSTDKEAAHAVARKFNVSLKTAQRDLNHARYVHGSRAKIDKDYERYWITQEAKRQYSIARDMAKPDLALKYLKLIVEAIGLNNKDDEKFPFEKLEAHNYYLLMNSGGSKSSIKLDLDKLDKITPDELQKIATDINREYLQREADFLNNITYGE